MHAIHGYLNSCLGIVFGNEELSGALGNLGEELQQCTRQAQESGAWHTIHEKLVDCPRPDSICLSLLQKHAEACSNSITAAASFEDYPDNITAAARKSSSKGRRRRIARKSLAVGSLRPGLYGFERSDRGKPARRITITTMIRKTRRIRKKLPLVASSLDFLALKGLK